MTENEIFARMFGYLAENNRIANQADMARLTGVSEVGISRILNGRVKRAKRSTLRQINDAFGGIFNPAWLRGESDVMLTADLPSERSEHSNSADGDDTPTTASLINAALAAKDETIKILKHELESKDETIATKNDLILSLRQQIADLRQLLAANSPHPETTKKGIYGAGYNNIRMAAAEEDNRSIYPNPIP